MRYNSFTNQQNDNVFDTDYLGLLEIASVVLEVYNIEQSADQSHQNDYMIKLLERMENRLDYLEDVCNRMQMILERG